MGNAGGGHVFVFRGDLARLACDAVLVPTDRALNVTESWRPFLAGVELKPAGSWLRVGTKPPNGWTRSVHAFPLSKTEDGPDVWLLNSGADDPRPEWLAEAVFHGIKEAAAQSGHGGGRAKRLLALPLVGTGDGGLRHQRGAVIEYLLPRLTAAARQDDVDIALVLHDGRDMAAVTARRDPGSWDALPEQVRLAAEDLGRRAATGDLSLFLGAGVSVALGLPDWRALVSKLLEEAGIEAAGDDHLLDAAQRAVEATGVDRFREIVQRWFTADRHTLAHGLLATLGVDQVVTTNYDNAYELADEGARGNRDLRVLVRDLPEPQTRWLLKIHGDALAPKTVVLTRDQYSDLAHRGAPLRGMVQSLLMTSHLLFVGYSLVDRTFLLLAEEVRAVLQDAQGGTRNVATVLSITRDEALTTRCKPDLGLVEMPVDVEDRVAGARLLEIFLDCLVCAAAKVRPDAVQHLLDERYAELDRRPEDLELKVALSGFLKDVGPAARHSDGWSAVREALLRLGADEGRV